MKKLIIFILITIFNALPAFSRIINIPADYSTIQSGINASLSGDTVLVAPGVYNESLGPDGRNILLTSSQGPETTFVRGGIGIGNGEDSTCIIRGFTFIGTSNDPWFGYGPVVGITGISTFPKVEGNIIRDNVCQGTIGSGVGFYNSNGIFRHNIVENNWGGYQAGGIFAWQYRNIEISYNVIRNNFSGFTGFDATGGAGIYVFGGRIFNNMIYRNAVDAGCGQIPAGAGILAHSRYRDATPTYIYNNTIARNRAYCNGNPGYGAGIYVTSWIEPMESFIIENNIIAFNIHGGLEAPAGIEVEYNLLYGNTDYDLRIPDTSETNIFANPLFADTANNDYHLLPGSPAIDAGDPSYPLDPDSTRVDIGALFYDQSTDIVDDNRPTGPYSFELKQNYPNPFNAQTRISYNLNKNSIINLTIFDITGRIVKRLAKSESQSPGQHSYLWEGKDSSGKSVSTAIYFYELEVDSQIQVKSMIMIK